MGHIILGIIFCVIGTFITFKSEWILREFGRTEFAEKYFPFEGGSRFFYKLIGIIIIFVGFLTIGGIHLTILNWIARTLFRGLIEMKK
jgi:hypothetical protein